MSVPLSARLIRHHGSHAILRNARQSWTARSGWLLELSDGHIRGCGEASPLPGHSAESFDEAESDLRALLESPLVTFPPPCARQAVRGDTTQLPSQDMAETASSWLEAHSAPLATASARFALETALLDFWSQRLGVPVWHLLTANSVAPTLHCSTVLDPLAEDLIERTERALGGRITTIKLKVGRDFERELDAIRRLRQRWSPERLRLRADANRQWRGAPATQHLERLTPYFLEWVEEPGDLGGRDVQPAVPVAADESLLGVEPSFDWLDQRPHVRVLVLKPMLLGGVSRCLRWAQLARQTGRSIVLSHMFDGPVALAACTQLAFAIQSPSLAPGLGLHGGLDAWRSRATAPSFVDKHELRLPQAPGLGVAVTERLSVLAAARECPHRTALVLPRRELSYAQLASAVTTAAQWLQTTDAWGSFRSSGRPLAVLAQPELAALVLSLTCIELGIPLLPLHPRWSLSERQRVLSDLEPLFVADEPVLAELEVRLSTALTGTTAALRETSVDEDGLAEEGIDSDPSVDPERDLAWLLTSGSTGTPRAVRLSRRAFLCAADASAERLGWRSGDRWLLSLPFAHVGGLSVLTRCLMARRTVVVDEKQPPRAWAAFLARHQVTLLSLVPTQLGRLLADPEFAFPPSVRAILVGGARAPAALIEQARTRHMPVLRTYGLTETCSQVATEPLQETISAAEAAEHREGYVGRILDGIEVRIDHENTIQLRGSQLFSGYVGQKPELSNGWFETSDRGRLEGDRLYVFGRRDNVIISGGENVAPEAVEAVLAQHSAIGSLCVLGEPDPEWGQRIVAVVELQEGTTIDDLKRWARERLASYERPRRWVVVSELPTLPSGKIDRSRVELLASSQVFGDGK